MIHRNNHFTCLHCNIPNPPLRGSCRNHCRFCLYSKHVDAFTPGDRQSICLGLMTPVSLDYSGKKGHVIIHHCQKCGKIIKNKAAKDDNFEKIIKLSKKQII